eukprot:c19662_g1_i1.p1 GENE.c19662_g1_i1~~c19662_g1_i1.p1  ORF type:complete len:275 (+),score=51.01 c19662_g1_i1:3-827(+)
MGSYNPECLLDGTFKPKQCNSVECWCVWANGVEVPFTRRPHAIESPLCRSDPPIEYAFPEIPSSEYRTSRRAQAIRFLTKLIYTLVPAEAYCPLGKKSPPVETRIAEILEASENVPCSAVAPSRGVLEPAATKYFNESVPEQLNIAARARWLPTIAAMLQKTLEALARCIQPPEPSATPSATPTTSAPPSVSSSPSPTPSSSVLVPCEGELPNNNVIQVIPTTQGECEICAEGTSGPCRDPRTLVCYPFVIERRCHNPSHQCATIDSPEPTKQK